MRSSGGVFLTGIADADGGVFIRQGKIPIIVYVMLELPWGHDRLSPFPVQEFIGLKRKQPTLFHQ